MFDTAHHRRNAIEQRRQLHARIARSRRRLNQHKSRLVQGGFLPDSWRKRIQEHPVLAMTTAAGAGMLLAQICPRTGGAGRSGDWLAQWLAGETWASMLKYVEQFLSTGESPSQPSATEPDDA